MVNHTDVNQLEGECIAKATQDYGVPCTAGDANDRCYFEKLELETFDDASAQDIHWGECRIFHDNAPFVECTAPK
jgi:hypothetical protein